MKRFPRDCDQQLIHGGIFIRDGGGLVPQPNDMHTSHLKIHISIYITSHHEAVSL